MKKILFPIVAIALVAFATPRIIAHKTESKLQDTVAATNEIAGYKARIVALESNWFSSSSLINLELDFSEISPQPSTDSHTRPVENVSFDIILDVQYGPIFLSAENKIGAIAWNAYIPHGDNTISFNDSETSNIYQNNGDMSLLGDVTYQDSFPAFTYTGDELGISVDFNGYSGSGKTVNDELVYSGELPSLNFNTNDFVIELEKLTLSFQGEYDYLAIMQGLYSDSITELNIDKVLLNNGQMAAINGFALYGNSNVNAEQLVDMEMGYKIAQINSPFDNFSDVEIAISFNNISSMFLQEYQQLAGKLVSIEPEEVKELITEPVLAALAHNPQFSIDNIGFKHASGTFSSGAKIALSDTKVNKKMLFEQAFWQSNIVVNSGLTLPVTLFKDLGKKYIHSQLVASGNAQGMTPEQLQEIAENQVDGMMAGFIQQGFLVENGNALTLTFDVENGQGNLNGNPFPIAAFFAQQ